MAVHEAGHAVVADALGLRVLGTIGTSEAISVQTYGSSGPFIDAVVAMAGAVAQERFGEPRGHGSHEDFQYAVQAAVDYAGKHATKEQIFATIAAAEALADDIIAARWGAVIAIASAIHEKHEQNASEIEVLFAEWVPERPTAPWPKRPSALLVLVARVVVRVWPSTWAHELLAVDRQLGAHRKETET
jgi:hypothetical protein